MAAARRSRLGSLFLLVVLGSEAAWADLEPAPNSLSEAFEPALGNTLPCQRTCQSTYPLHTYPKVRKGKAAVATTSPLNHSLGKWFAGLPPPPLGVLVNRGLPEGGVGRRGATLSPSLSLSV